jgi:hypothetical protein
MRVWAACRFAFKMKFFIFHGATKSGGCGLAFALNCQVIIKSQYHLAQHWEVCGSLSGFFPSSRDKTDFCVSMMRLRGRAAATE